MTRSDKAPSPIYVVPLEGGAVPPQRWIPAAAEPGLVSPVWSQDGTAIYYFSDKDGKVCVYGQRLDELRRNPSGRPSP